MSTVSTQIEKRFTRLTAAIEALSPDDALWEATILARWGRIATPCPYCDGTGRRVGESNGIGMRYVEPCTECEGAGK